MSYATNPLDGVRTYFEDEGGDAPAVLFYTGFADPLEVAKASALAGALSHEFRLVFADHRGQGRSDKPWEVDAYALATRTADAVAILDTLGLHRAHFVGSSWGARLGLRSASMRPSACRPSSCAGTNRTSGTSTRPLPTPPLRQSRPPGGAG